jgi:hypothetical protein
MYSGPGKSRTSWRQALWLQRLSFTSGWKAEWVSRWLLLILVWGLKSDCFSFELQLNVKISNSKLGRLRCAMVTFEMWKVQLRRWLRDYAPRHRLKPDRVDPDDKDRSVRRRWWKSFWSRLNMGKSVCCGSPWARSTPTKIDRFWVMTTHIGCGAIRTRLFRWNVIL